MKLPRSLDETCLFFDVDGSLIDLAPRPDDVVVPAGLLDDLNRAGEAVNGALALVSGRSVEQLDRLFSPMRFRASGVHGAEMRFEPGDPVGRSEDDIIVKSVWDDLEHLLESYPGTLVENKQFSFAVHYRAVPQVEEVLRADLKALLDRHRTSSLSLMPGHFVFELKRLTFNKGMAIRRFLAHPRFAGRIPVFVGDDVTDQPGFAAVLDFGGQAFSVSARFPGTTGLFANPAAVRHWVAEIAQNAEPPRSAATERLHA